MRGILNLLFLCLALTVGTSATAQFCCHIEGINFGGCDPSAGTSSQSEVCITVFPGTPSGGTGCYECGTCYNDLRLTVYDDQNNVIGTKTVIDYVSGTGFCEYEVCLLIDNSWTDVCNPETATIKSELLDLGGASDCNPPNDCGTAASRTHTFDFTMCVDDQACLLDGSPSLTCLNDYPVNGYITYTLTGGVEDCDICAADACFEGWDLEWTYPDGTKFYEFIDQDSLTTARGSCDLYSFKTFVDNVDPCDLGNMTVKITNRIDGSCTETCRDQTYTINIQECSGEICLGGFSGGGPQALYNPNTGAYTITGDGFTRVQIVDHNGSSLLNLELTQPVEQSFSGTLRYAVPIVSIIVDGKPVDVNYVTTRNR